MKNKLTAIALALLLTTTAAQAANDSVGFGADMTGADVKNRPDTEYNLPPVDPANMNSQALRIQSQPGTGFERGIVYAQLSMHASRNLVRPVAIDFSEMDEAAVEAVDLIRFPDGCSLVYLGHGMLSTRCDKQGPDEVTRSPTKQSL